MMMDWIVLLSGIVSGFILLVDMLFIHEFVGMYNEMAIISAVLIVAGTV